MLVLDKKEKEEEEEEEEEAEEEAAAAAEEEEQRRLESRDWPVLEPVDARVLGRQVLIRVPRRRAERLEPAEAREAHARRRVERRVDLRSHTSVFITNQSSVISNQS